ncbi:hypothetical protein BLA29_004580, partial [Euroglyphus maynei]
MKDDRNSMYSSSNHYDSPYHQFGYYPEDELNTAIDDESGACSVVGGGMSGISLNSNKQTAATRYHRNNVLISEVFSDKVMPDVRTIVTNSRLEVLRKQADSLILHQERSLGELANMEQSFKEKKRKLLESSEEFNRQLDRFVKQPALDQEMYQKMIDAAMEQIRQQHSDQKQQQENGKTVINDSIKDENQKNSMTTNNGNSHTKQQQLQCNGQQQCMDDNVKSNDSPTPTSEPPPPPPPSSSLMNRRNSNENFQETKTTNDNNQSTNSMQPNNDNDNNSSSQNHHLSRPNNKTVQYG